jgi:hypothetical protein
LFDLHGHIQTPLKGTALFPRPSSEKVAPGEQLQWQ